MFKNRGSLILGLGCFFLAVMIALPLGLGVGWGVKTRAVLASTNAVASSPTTVFEFFGRAEMRSVTALGPDFLALKVIDRRDGSPTNDQLVDVRFSVGSEACKENGVTSAQVLAFLKTPHNGDLYLSTEPARGGLDFLKFIQAVGPSGQREFRYDGVISCVGQE